MRLLVGLGNPGSRYEGNRHNIGFLVLDRVAQRWRFASWRSRFQALVAEGEIAGERVLLMKPQTYMNESGRAVGEAARFYKIGLPDLTVFHDELDLAPAKVRVKTGGGNAGHNGLRSITAHLGNEYRRVRLGIGHPGDKNLVQPHVLSDFTRGEQEWLRVLEDAVADNAERVVAGDDAGFQNRVHLALDAAGFKEKTGPAAGRMD